MTSGVRQRLTQQERSDRTRELLLDATVDCLVELGYARTSMNEICRRAGLSRGAQQHHFTTKAELMAHAVEHLVGKLSDQLRAVSTLPPPGPDRIAAAIDLLWRAFSGSLSTAAMELWVAARTDPELRAAMHPIDRGLARSTIEVYRELLGDQLGEERLEKLFWLTVNITRGLALDAMIGGDQQRRDQLLDEWKAIATSLSES
ncbi:TetR/AcrR family transcriptional regulator [Solihabitans fulvus]|uniref:TetR/AcrR family transcriptional regulator n=1 Tax=Solihabitans fulvus TaxID=1892852 RepID=A0A5B2X6S1_9PSEU|nr:TetR/AcrR family transcriptional regulator [Solihabitans fulvus]KAA2258821.1 TetR/AcrR family transcriptional regulator [Solihabitans fulvus]